MTIENNNRSLSPQSVGREFVRQYYTLLNEAPAHLHRFYNNSSSFVHGGLGPATREMPVVVGQRQIHQQIQQLNFRDCHAKISQVDSQATLDNGVVVQVSGELSNAGQPMRRFTQTFVLAAQSPKKYYVHNDIFRYQDLLSDEELENDLTRSEAEDDQQNGGGPHSDIQAAEVNNQTATAYYGGVNQVVNGIPETKTIEEVQPEPAYNNIDLIQQQQAPSLPDGGQIEQQSPANQGPYVLVDLPQPQQPEPTPEFHMPSQPPVAVVQPQIVPNNEPKTYANLVKQGHQVGGTVYYNSNNQSISQQSQQHTSETTSPPPHIKNDKVFEPRPVQNSPKPQRMEGQQQRNNYNSAARQQNNEDSNGGSNGNYAAGDGDRRRSQYNDNHQVFVGNIPHTASENELRELFGQYGAIVDFKILSKSTSKGPAVMKLPFYGFIIFEDVNSVQAVLNAKPIMFPDENGVRLNVEEKKTRRGDGGGRGRSAGMMGRGGGAPPRGGPRSGVRFSAPVARR